MQKVLDFFIQDCKKHNLVINFAQISDSEHLLASFQRLNTKARLNMWSVSKGFVSCAAGIALSECLITLDEKLIDFFPEYHSLCTSSHVQDISLKHLLTMSCGLENPLFFADSEEFYTEKNWIQYFFQADFPHAPGSYWLYSNFNTYMLSCAIEKRAEMNLKDYLEPRLFDKLGITNPVWTTDPLGHVHAANGLYLNIDELSAYGQMLLMNGRFHGEQVIPSEYLEQATTKQIDNSSGNEMLPLYKRNGYGYQFWINATPHSFRNDGRYGQYCIVYPDQNLTVTIMSLDDNTDKLEELLYNDIVKLIS